MKLMFRLLRAIAPFGIFLIASACASQSPLTQTTATSNLKPVLESNEQSGTSTSEQGGAIVLTVWLPPTFDTAGGNLAASMLDARFAEFSEQHPQVRIETRIKAEDGTGGLLDSLLAAQAAAPLSQPDLILLPHIKLEAAVQAGILQPITTTSSETDGEDWYPFAEQMVTVDGQSYGIAFAADGLAVAFRPTAVSSIPSNWNAYLETRRPLGLAVADRWSQFSIAELVALEEPPADAAEFSFTQQNLRDLFEFYASAQARGVFPFWLTQYQTYEQSWQAFTEGRVPMVVAWISRIFDSRNVEILGAPLPTQNGQPFTLVKGWVFAITTPNAERTELVTELIEFLTTPEFIAQWSAAAGMLPPRASSLAAWSPDEKQALVSQIIADAVALPPEATLDLWGQSLADATVAILKQELTPQEAAEAVLNAVENPE